MPTEININLTGQIVLLSKPAKTNKVFTHEKIVSAVLYFSPTITCLGFILQLV